MRRPGRANLFLGMADLPSYWTYLSLNTAIGTTGNLKAQQRGEEGRWRKLLLKRETVAWLGGKKKEKSGRIQGCKWWITFHQVKGNILRNNPENGAGRLWPRASEQPISSFKKTTMKLHRKWDCHERALENLGVQSLWRRKEPSSTHHTP